jgi:cell division septum initiation protein DivIVA
MSTPPERYPTVRQGYDPSLVESDLAAMERAHRSVVDDASAKIAALEQALELASTHSGATVPQDAEQIVASARKEAFRLITEAREEAGLVIAEAHTEVEHTPPAETPGSATPDQIETLRAEELRLEARIVELEATLAGLEAGIRSLTGILATPETQTASVPPPPPVRQEISLEGEVPTEVASLTANGGAALIEPTLVPPRRQSAPPPPPPREPELAAAVQVEDLTVEVVDSLEQAPTLEDEPRASWYTRRSAQLPHIGAEAGRNAIAAATELRASMGQKSAGKREA